MCISKRTKHNTRILYKQQGVIRQEVQILNLLPEEQVDDAVRQFGISNLIRQV